MRVLVTGVSGFVGGALAQRIAREAGWQTRGASRRRPGTPVGGAEWVTGPDLSAGADWSAALDGVDAVVHAAARVHVMRDTASDPLAAYRRANVDGSLALARQAAAAGVRRLVFVSSVKVHGERTLPGRPFRADDVPAPADPYGVSKWEAERALRELADRVGLELAIVRPVLVYGPGVGANFGAMLDWLRRGVPLPLGAVRDNRRSLIAVGNLADLLVRCVWHPAAAGRTFLASDGEDLSTTDLLRRAAAALGVRPRLLAVPPVVLRAAAAAIGRAGVARRLCDSLQVDITATGEALGWTPPIAVDAALADTARARRTGAST